MPGPTAGVPAPQYVTIGMLREQARGIQIDVHDLPKLPLLQRAAAAEELMRKQDRFNHLVVEALNALQTTWIV
ncbi:MAG TPA: hypothetical protein VED01_07755 [Burkholderiales bacterium]|nr:hypothetical protein [Burkholderiales bacterium]